MADTVGESRGEGRPDPLASRPLRSLDSRDATCKGGCSSQILFRSGSSGRSCKAMRGADCPGVGGMISHATIAAE